MRLVGTTLAACLVAAAALAQPPAGPAPATPGAPPSADPQLDSHLANWEKTMRGVSNFHAGFELTRTEAVFKKKRKYTGRVSCMKPNLTVLRINSTTDKNDYEAYICDGKSIYEYNGLANTITEFRLNAGAEGENLMLDFLSGMTADAARKRFQIALFNPSKPDPMQIYIYLDIKPVLGKDKQEFEHARFALFGPGAPEALRYQPAQVFLRKPNGDQELWTFSDQKTNVPGVDAKAFQFVKIDGWQFRQAPASPAPGPAPMPPGAKRP
jgi:TIGR03009 family protein